VISVAKQLYCADCLDILKSFPDNCVDLIITDPPYNWKKDIVNDNMEWDEYELWLRPIIKELYRVLKDNSFIVSDIPRTKLDFFQKMFSEYFEFYDYLCNFVNNSMANCAFGIDRFNLKIVLRKGEAKVKRRRSNVVVSQRYASFNFLHPTQKDVKVYRYIISMLCPEEGIVLDPFMGSGTSALASKQLRCHYVGIELEEKYVNIARERLSQKVLFPLAEQEEGGNGIPLTAKAVGILPKFL
jgi:DNA modification methylase